MSAITTHILDTSRGLPASEVAVELQFLEQGEWTNAGGGKTDSDGRIKGLVDPSFDFRAGHYKLKFAVAEYFEARNVNAFYPYVEIVFSIEDTGSHYHVPLLLNPFGYSTYRGS